MAAGKHIQKFASIYFRLPDDKLVLQRRTNDAPNAPGKLGSFGGRVEESEAAYECLVREIAEETSLNSDVLSIKLVTDFTMPADEVYNFKRHFYIYEARIKSLDFEVFEGSGAEAYSVEELRSRDDLTSSAASTLRYLNSH